MRWHRLLILSLLIPSFARGAEHPVASAAEIARLKPAPGDVLVLKSGTWTDQSIKFSASGTADKPITLRALEPGKAILTGKSSLTIDGDHLVISGIFFRNIERARGVVQVKGSHCRLSQCAIVCPQEPGNYLRLWGKKNRVDHCYFAEKATDMPTVQVEVEEQPGEHQIDHNHFGPRPVLGHNGGETLRIGYSHQSMRDGGVLVESNLFDRCDGEIEIISNKSCGNTYRWNSFIDCGGTLTLRHGNRCIVDGNFFLGKSKRGSGGIRVIAEDHRIFNNYIEATDRGGIIFTDGIPNSPLEGYFQVKNCLVAFNTIVNNKGPCITMSQGSAEKGQSLRPRDITIAHNVLLAATKGLLLDGTMGEGWKWQGNFAFGGRDTPARAGLTVADPKLQRASDGLMRPGAGSPVHNTVAKLAGIDADIDGQPRTTQTDAGCDQASREKPANHPLTAADVGPSWLKER